MTIEDIVQNEMYKLELLESWAKVDNMTAIDKFLEIYRVSYDAKQKIIAECNHPEFLLRLCHENILHDAHMPVFIDRIHAFEVKEASPDRVLWKAMFSGFVSIKYDSYRNYWMIWYDKLPEDDRAYVRYRHVNKAEINQWRKGLK